MPFNEVFFGNGHTFSMDFDWPVFEPISEDWELLMLTPYKDPSRFGDRKAIGFGHVEGGENEPKVIPDDMVITPEEARAIHRLDLETKARWLRKKIHVPVTTFQFGAMTLLTMNAGEGNVGRGRVLPLLNAEKYVSAGAAFFDHRFKWIDQVDMNGKPVIDPRTGKPYRVRVEDNGLIMRRGCEIGVYRTKRMK